MRALVQAVKRKDRDADQVVSRTRDLLGGRPSSASLAASVAWNRLMRRLAKEVAEHARERATDGSKDSGRA